MSGSIRLHKDHGLNPTICVCIICGGDTGEIALLGAGYKGEAPMKMVTGIEPCKACREKYLRAGVLLVEFESEKGSPTGRVVVLADKAFVQGFNTPAPKSKIARVELGLLEKITAV